MANNKEYRYFAVSVFSKTEWITKTSVKYGGLHVIKAKSIKDAIEIRNKFGISNPWGAKREEVKISCKPIDMRHKFNKERIEKRRKFIGGKIWFENILGKLDYEQ